jgi:hypothetical protein
VFFLYYRRQKYVNLFASEKQKANPVAPMEVATALCDEDFSHRDTMAFGTRCDLLRFVMRCLLQRILL